MNQPMNQKQTHRHKEQTCGYQGRGMEGEAGVSRGKLLSRELMATRPYSIAQKTVIYPNRTP